MVFALLPVLTAGLIVATLPTQARNTYIVNLHALDFVILGLGSGLFAIQTLLAFRALQWKGDTFDEVPDPWINRLAQSSEWFPLLGLIGTVAGIMQTFSALDGKTSPNEIVKLYAPALTATGSGLFMAFVNILPAWMILIGRGLILGLGEAPKSQTP
jgi:hypothetical protein